MVQGFAFSVQIFVKLAFVFEFFLTSTHIIKTLVTAELLTKLPIKSPNIYTVIVGSDFAL